jgi:hypothetical protein
MKKKQKTPNFSEAAEITPEPKKQEINSPNALSDFYQKHYKILFDKLSPAEQEELTANLKKAGFIVRGQIREYENVRKFTRDVIEAAETEYDKAQAKKLKEIATSTKEK